MTNDSAPVNALVLAALQHYDAALAARDADAQAAFFASNWKSKSGMTRDGLRKHIQATIDDGSYVEQRWALDDVTVVIEADRATVDGADLRSPTGGGRFVFEMVREADGAWHCSDVRLSDQINEQAQAARSLREKIAIDPHRPGFHFCNPEGIAMPFDPNGAIWWRGRYHLFYIFQDNRLGHRADHWGHVSSTNLFHWRHHPTHLLDGMYSGNCFINADGVPTICYHQKGEGNAMAVSVDDDLNEWTKLDVITPETQPDDPHHGKYRSWDPFGWLEGNTYYAIFGGKNPGIARSSNLTDDWEYAGDLFAHGVDGVALDEDVSCADLFHLGNKDVLLCISHRMGCRYYVGEWRDEQFYPESHAQMSWVDHAFFAPESLLDNQGRRIMWAWLMDEPRFGTRASHGWSGTMSLPRVLTLGDDGLLGIEVPDEIALLRGQPFQFDPVTVDPETEHDTGISGNSLELCLDLEARGAERYGIKVCVAPDGSEQSLISYNAKEKLLQVDTRQAGPGEGALESAPLALRPDETLKLRIFIDKSVIEVFANGRQAIARRIYPSRPDSLGVHLFAEGSAVRVTGSAWQINPASAS